MDAVLVQPSTTGALGRLCWYNRVLWSTLETVLVQQNTIGTLEMPCEVVPVQLSTIGAPGHCAGSEWNYRSTGEAVLVQQSTIGALGVGGGSACIPECYCSTLESLLVQQNT